MKVHILIRVSSIFIFVDCPQTLFILSCLGAQEIISMIISRPPVTKLILSHNNLGDNGCNLLFKFLCSNVGRRKHILEIKLANNGIEDQGLLAISEYLGGNEILKDLYIPQNAFKNTPSVVSTFTAALNASHLEKLNLSSNRQLSDPFVASFLPHLDTPHLRDLCLSITGLTPLSIPYIVSYISSPRCRLHNLSLNGNELGLQGVTDIIQAVEKSNFGLGKLELYSNQRSKHGVEEGEKENEQVLKRALIRNQYLKRQVEREALGLLISARPSLLRPKSIQEVPSTSCPASSPSQPPSLPTEVQLLILSFLAPTLSNAQRIRIYTYASTFSTLPDLLPRLGSGGSRGGVGLSNPKHFGPLTGLSNFKSTGCLEGCIRGILCQREEERGRWLKLVGCDFYEREDMSGGDRQAG